MLKFNGDSITFNDDSNQNTSAQNVVNEALENQVIAGNGISVSYDSDNDLLTISNSGEIVLTSGTFDVISFNKEAEVDLLQGQIAWNDTEGTVDIGLTDTIAVSIGEHTVFRVRNETGGALY